MKLAAYVLAVILIIVAGIYLWLPADSLPSFFPGYESGLTRPHTKHGLVAGAAGAFMFVVGWFLRR